MCVSKEVCAVVMKELCNSKDFYLVVKGCKEASSSKYDRFRYEMIGETQPEME